MAHDDIKYYDTCPPLPSVSLAAPIIAIQVAINEQSFNTLDGVSLVFAAQLWVGKRPPDLVIHLALNIYASNYTNGSFKFSPYILKHGRGLYSLMINTCGFQR